MGDLHRTIGVTVKFQSQYGLILIQFLDCQSVPDMIISIPIWSDFN